MIKVYMNSIGHLGLVRFGYRVPFWCRGEIRFGFGREIKGLEF